MLSLIMDTSNTYLAIGLVKDGIFLEKVLENGSQRQSEYAIPKLKEVLEAHHYTLLEIDEMIITRGPGSYTGVRVAMTIAKTIAAISDVKIKVVSSLKAYAGNKKVVSIIDARSHKVFVCDYKQSEKEELMTIEECKNRYQNDIVVGDAYLIDKYCDNEFLLENIYEISQEVDYIENVDFITPTYLKDVDAKKI